MKPDQVLNFGKMTEGGQVVINGVGINKITVLGSSVPVSCKIGDDVSYLTLMPKKEGVLAVRVTAFNYRDRNDRTFIPEVDFLLNIEKEEGGLYRIGESNHGKTKQGLCQLVQGIIQVKAGETFFFSAPPYQPDKNLSFSVIDGDTLCQYVAGDITLDELGEKAEAVEAEKSASERLPKLEAELSRIKEKAAWNWENFLESEEREKEVRRSIAKAAEDMHNVKMSLQEICGASIWSIRDKLKDLIKKMEIPH